MDVENFSIRDAPCCKFEMFLHVLLIETMNSKGETEMTEERTDHKLGELIKSLLKKKSLSMRRLSALTGIETATISRIANGKQPARLNHLKQFSDHLQYPLEKFIHAAGFTVETEHKESNFTMNGTVDTIKEILGASNFFDQEYTETLVEQELIKYEQYAQTEEGRRIILSDFQGKVEQVNGAGPFIEQLKEMYRQYCDPATSLENRAVLGSGLLYFILSTDIIPDYVFPIGYLDDAIAVQIVSNRLRSEA